MDVSGFIETATAEQIRAFIDFARPDELLDAGGPMMTTSYSLSPALACRCAAAR